MQAEVTDEMIRRAQAPWMTAMQDLWAWARRNVKVRRARRRLRVCETLSLGERRFLAVIEFDHQEFLVGGSGNSLELLARLQGETIIPQPAGPWDLRRDKPV